MDTKVAVKSPFTKYGHDCTLDELPDEFEYCGIPPRGCFNQFRRWLIRVCVVSESSKMYTHHLRSFGAIVKERQRQVLNYGFRIHPFSKAYLFWSIVMIMVIFLKIFCTALDFLFYSLEDSFVLHDEWQCFGTFLDVIFLMNLIICFFTGYYDEPKQEVVLDSKKICLNNEQKKRIADAVIAFFKCIVCFEFMGELNNHDAVLCARGHIMCEECFIGLINHGHETCPVCRINLWQNQGPGGQIINRLISEIANNLQVPGDRLRGGLVEEDAVNQIEAPRVAPAEVFVNLAPIPIAPIAAPPAPVLAPLIAVAPVQQVDPDDGDVIMYNVMDSPPYQRDMEDDGFFEGNEFRVVIPEPLDVRELIEILDSDEEM